MTPRKYRRPGRPPGRTGRGGNRPTNRSHKARASTACLLMALVSLAYDLYSKTRAAVAAATR